MRKQRVKHTYKVFTDGELYNMLLQTRSVEAVLASMEQKERRLKMLTRPLPTEGDKCITFAKNLVSKIRY